MTRTWGTRSACSGAITLFDHSPPGINLLLISLSERGMQTPGSLTALAAPAPALPPRFKRRLPKYATRFIEMCIVLCADHGPCVSGAHNTIVTARAGKDLISCLVSGLLTIGPRFGGAIDDAARCFQAAVEEVGVGVVQRVVVQRGCLVAGRSR